MVSIIVTVYNLETYCEKCIQSVLNQTYRDIEVILVDDGSTDHSFQILQKYQKDYPNVRLIRKDNGGVSSARNAGLEEAQGEFICFVDGDDVVSPFMVEELLKCMDPKTCAVVGNHIRVPNQSVCLSDRSGDVKSFCAETCVEKILRGTFPIGCSAALFRKQSIGQLRFNCEIRLNEDKVFLISYILANRDLQVKRTGTIVYGYFVRDGSASRAKWNGRLDRIIAAEIIKKEVAKVYPQLEHVAVNSLLSAILKTAGMIIMDDSASGKNELAELRRRMILTGIPYKSGRLLKVKYIFFKAGIKPYTVLTKTYYLLTPDKRRFRRNEKALKN